VKVRWSEDADQDREAILAYIWANSPAAAERMNALFDAAGARLARFPNIGSESAVPGLRDLIPHPSYRLVYEVTRDEIVIHTLIHTKRQWPPIPNEGDG